MAYQRLASIPVDHLVAEMAAFPLASESSIRHAPIQLDPLIASSGSTVQGAPPLDCKRATAALWRDAERFLVTRSPAVSLDEVIAIRDKLWFRHDAHAAGRPVPLTAYSRRVAESYLRSRGSTAAPCLRLDGEASQQEVESVSKPRSREAWRWLTFALPPDFLLAVLDRKAIASRVESLSPQMDRTLREYGFAEIHLHLGAALGFDQLWIATMCGIGEHETDEVAFGSPGAAFDEGRDFVHWLIRVAIGRYVLAAYLTQHRAGPDSALTLRAYLRLVVNDRIRAQTGLFGGCMLNRGLGELALGRLDRTRFHLAEYQLFYRQLTCATGRSMPQGSQHWSDQVFNAPRSQLDLVYRADPLSEFWGVSSHSQPSPEMHFIAASLDYMESRRTPDVEFDRLFWQIERVRNLFYRHLVQRPMTPGLPWFVRTYGRIAAARRTIATPLQVESAAMKCGLGEGLRSLELRVSPTDNAGSMAAFLREAQQHFHGITRDVTGAAAAPELGFVFHLARERHGGSRQGYPNAYWADTHADPTNHSSAATAVTNPTGYRYAAYYQKIRREMLAFGRMLLHFPMSQTLVRGIDLCTDEMAIPIWVTAPLFRYVRDISIGVSHWLENRCHSTVPPLRTTVHAGEDFVHLLGGLRRIEESVNKLGLREGDRIGHAIALGIDARSWAEAAGRLAVPREERLFDLVWEWSCYARKRVPATAARHLFLEREIGRLTELLYGQPIAPFEMETYLDSLFREDILAAAGFPDGSRSSQTAAASGTRKEATTTSSPIDGGVGRRLRTDHIRPGRWVESYLCSPEVFRRGRQIEWVDPTTEAESLDALQRFLRRDIGQRGLTVEINPSSNLLIANLGDLSHHPLWRLNPPIPIDDVPPVSVCIGSDDPITFATSLKDEYMLVRDTLVQSGCSDVEAGRWLDRVRETGLMMRFTLPREQQKDLRTPCGPVPDRHIRLPL